MSVIRSNPFPIFVLFLGYLTASVLTPVCATETGVSGKSELTFLTWPEYTAPQVVRKFEEKYGVVIRMVYFNSDSERDAILVKDEGSHSFDLALVDAPTVRQYRNRGWLSAIDAEQVPNLANIEDRWLKKPDAINGYAVPYLWGTLGIAYRKDLVEVQIDSWKQLYDPTEALSGKVFMIKDARELTGTALKALGFSMNSNDKDELEAARQLLHKQKPHVKSYDYMDLRDNSPLYTGEGVVSMAYNGDALSLQELNPNITYVLPREGGSIWVDYVAIMQGSRSKELAYKFIDFLNEPENAAEIAQYAYNASPNRAAEKLLPEEFLNDKAIYPDPSALVKSETYEVLAPKTMRQINIIYSEIVGDL